MRFEQDEIRYLKTSIRQYDPSKGTLHINLSALGADSTTMQNFKWRLSRDKRNLLRYLDDDEKYSYPHYETALDLWQTNKKEHGNSIIQWIGKLYERNKWRHKQTQPHIRTAEAVSLVVQDKNSDRMTQWIWWQNFCLEEQTFDVCPEHTYNRSWEYHKDTDGLKHQVKRFSFR